MHLLTSGFPEGKRARLQDVKPVSNMGTVWHKHSAIHLSQCAIQTRCAQMCLAACSHSFQCGLSINASILKWTSRRRRKGENRGKIAFLFSLNSVAFPKISQAWAVSEAVIPITQVRFLSWCSENEEKKRLHQQKKKTKNRKQAAGSPSFLYHRDHPVVNYVAYLHPRSWKRKALSASF